MAKKVSQVRYFGPNAKNGQNNVDATALVNGSAFSYPIVQLGVQALPGTRLLINNSETPLTIGATGIYELDIDGLATITSLMFAANSIPTASNPDAYIIVDYVYDQEG